MLVEVFIGSGGWAYFPSHQKDKLLAYSRLFDYVEVNSTFYIYPSLQLVKSWRRRVPPSFTFSVRCHRDVTHTYGLEPNEYSFRAFERMRRVCKELSSEVLHIETPSFLKMNKDRIALIRDFLGSVNLNDLTLAWEIRGATTLPTSLVNLMRDFDIIHCTDLSRQSPSFGSSILYSRLFGKGRHNIYQFSDDELLEVNKKAEANHKRVYLVFHSLKMYKDANRLRIFRSTGSFPQITRSVGPESLRKVLQEDARFPSSKEQLIAHQGWKMIDMTPDKRVRASELLTKLQAKVYHDVDEVIEELAKLE